MALAIATAVTTRMAMSMAVATALAARMSLDIAVATLTCMAFIAATTAAATTTAATTATTPFTSFTALARALRIRRRAACGGWSSRAFNGSGGRLRSRRTLRLLLALLLLL
jgi:hypothetical protein